VELLNSILEDGDQGELLIALRQMTKVFGSLSKVAEKAQLNGTHIYRTLSAKGSPEILIPFRVKNMNNSTRSASEESGMAFDY